MTRINLFDGDCEIYLDSVGDLVIKVDAGQVTIKAAALGKLGYIGKDRRVHVDGPLRQALDIAWHRRKECMGCPKQFHPNCRNEYCGEERETMMEEDEPEEDKDMDGKKRGRTAHIMPGVVMMTGVIVQLLSEGMQVML